MEIWWLMENGDVVARGDGVAHGNVISRHSHGDKVALFVYVVAFMEMSRLMEIWWLAEM